jgi:hypothetical protein
MSSSRTIATLAVAVLLVFAGCTGAMSGSDSGAPVGGSDLGAAQGGAGDAVRAETGAGGDGGGGGGQNGAADDVSNSVAAQERMLILTGEISLRVDDYEQTRSALEAMARDRGGYVSDSTERTHRRGDTTWKTGTVVIRVPSDDFTAAFEEAKGHGSVESASTSSQDVTEQVIDIEARLENLRAERDRLRTLYEQANETEDVLRVSRELSNVQEQIERLEARQRQLESQVQYATITVRIDERPDDLPTPGPDGWWETGVLDAFLSSVSGVFTVARAVVVGIAYVAPYVLAFGTPVVLGAYLVVRRLMR